MRLTFETISIENFRSFNKTQTLNLRLQPGLYAVRGKNEVEPSLSANGAGKSTILHALSWALTGKAPDNLKAPDLKPWGKTKSPAVSVELSCDTAQHTVTRSPGTVLIDSKEVGGEGPSQLIRLNHELLTNTILLPQGKPLFFDYTPKEKMQIFAEVLQLEKWEERSAKASDETRRLETEASRLEGELEGAKSSLAQLEELLKVTAEKAAAWGAEHKTRTATLKKEARLKEEELAQASSELRKLSKAVTEAAAVCSQLAGARFALLKEKASAAEKVDAVHRKIGELRREVAALQTELGEASTTTCPTCGQPFVTLEARARHARTLEKRIETINAEIRAGVPTKLSNALNSAEKALSDQEEKLEAAEESSRSAAREALRQGMHVEGLTQALKNTSTQLKGAAEETNPHTAITEELTRKREALLAKQETQKATLKALLETLESTKFWIKGFKDVQLYVVEEVLQELEAATNEALPEVGLDDWSVNFSVERETRSGTTQRALSVFIKSPANEKPVRWESWSGGEAQRLRLVGALALSEVLLNYAGVDPNLEVLDEPTQHLSAEGVKSLCEYLSARAKRLKRVTLLIDHHIREGTEFAGAFTVTKTLNGSVIRQE